MLHLLQIDPFKVLTLHFFQIQHSRQLLLLELPFLLRSCFFWRSHTYQHCIFLFGLLQFACLHCATGPIWPSLLTQHVRPTLAFKSLIPFRPLRIFSLCTLITASCSWLIFYTSCFLFPLDFLRILQWNAGSLPASSTELLHFISSHYVDLIIIQKFNLNSSFSFRIPGFSALRSDCTHSRSGILSFDATHASGGVIIFIRQGLSFSKLSTSSLSSLDPYCDYIGISILLNNPS